MEKEEVPSTSLAVEQPVPIEKEQFGGKKGVGKGKRHTVPNRSRLASGIRGLSLHYSKPNRISSASILLLEDVAKYVIKNIVETSIKSMETSTKTIQPKYVEAAVRLMCSNRDYANKLIAAGRHWITLERSAKAATDKKKIHLTGVDSIFNVSKEAVPGGSSLSVTRVRRIMDKAKPVSHRISHGASIETAGIVNSFIADFVVKAKDKANKKAGHRLMTSDFYEVARSDIDIVSIVPSYEFSTVGGAKVRPIGNRHKRGRSTTKKSSSRKGRSKSRGRSRSRSPVRSPSRSPFRAYSPSPKRHKRPVTKGAGSSKQYAKRKGPKASPRDLKRVSKSKKSTVSRTHYKSD